MRDCSHRMPMIVDDVCTLAEAFLCVSLGVGFNVEIKYPSIVSVRAPFGLPPCTHHAQNEAEEEYNLAYLPRNEFVDCVLDAVGGSRCVPEGARCGRSRCNAQVFRHVGTRAVIFSSFDPDVCKLTALKQPWFVAPAAAGAWADPRRLPRSFPVFFLTEAGSNLYYDPRMNSLKAAVHFARRCNFMGPLLPAAP